MYDLDERFCTHISPHLNDIHLEDIDKQYRILVSQSKYNKETRKEMDSLFFNYNHYP